MPHLAHDDKAVPIERVHQRLRLRIVRAAVAVRAHFFQQLHFVAVDVFGHGAAGKPEVLVGVDALDLYLSAV